MKLWRACLIVSTIFATVATSSAQKKTATNEDAIRVADQGWAVVFGAKDVKASVEFCADDASFMAPNALIAIGKQAISQAFAGLFTIPELKITWHPTKIEVARSGDLGYSTGVYEMSFKDASGKPATDRGKYVTLWKKQKDGSWKVVYDIFNSDLPAASGQ